MDSTNVIIKPLITEKSTHQQTTRNAYAFQVRPSANKHQIKQAVESIFDVDVVKVATMVMPLKRGRRGRKFYQRSPEWKKAIVTLPAGQTISLFNV